MDGTNDDLQNMTPKEKKNQPSKHSYFTDNITKKSSLK